MMIKNDIEYFIDEKRHSTFAKDLWDKGWKLMSHRRKVLFEVMRGRKMEMKFYSKKD